MNKLEKTIVLSTFLVCGLYIILFNMNMPHYWSGDPLLVPELIIDWLWWLGLISCIVTIVICIRDTGKRKLENRDGWVAYMVLFGVVGIPHYYIKYGRHSR
jgi:hypothetical protein